MSEIISTGDFKTVKVLMLKGEKGDNGTSGDYAGLSNKPSINGIELIGNKTTTDLSLISEATLDAAVASAVATAVEDATEELSTAISDEASARESADTYINTRVSKILLGLSTEIIYSSSMTLESGVDLFDSYDFSGEGIFIGSLKFAYNSNATGRRATRAYWGGHEYLFYDTRMAVSGAQTTGTFPVIANVSDGSAIYFMFYQNSGSNLSVSYSLVGRFIPFQ